MLFLTTNCRYDVRHDEERVMRRRAAASSHCGFAAGSKGRGDSSGALPSDSKPRDGSRVSVDSNQF